MTAYLLAAAVFLPISAWLADRFGAKRVFRAAIIWFVVSSMLAGLADSLPMLIAARFLQGMAGALIVPVGRLVMLRSVPKSQLIQAMTWLAMPAMIGPVIGPPLGGFIVTFFSWRWIFFINLPIALLGLYLTARYLPDVREEMPGKLDVRGFILSGLGLAGIVYGLDSLGRSHLSPVTIATLLIGGAVCCLLYGIHAWRTPRPILDFSILRNRTYTAAVVGGFFSRLIIGAQPFLIAILLQIGFGLTALQSGLISLGSAIGALSMRTAAWRIIGRFGFRTVLSVNGLMVAAMSGAYSLFAPTTPHWLLFLTLLLGGLFRSLQFAALNALAYADVPAGNMSGASSLSSVFQQLAQSVGIGLSATVIHYTMLWRGDVQLGAPNIGPAFMIISIVSLLSLAFFVPLPRNAGAEVSGRRG